MITPLPIRRLPPGARILFNNLFRERRRDLLTQGIAAVKLSNGKVINVSWYPQFDPKGSYTISVRSGSMAAPSEQEIETASVYDVVDTIERLAHDLAEPVVVRAISNTTEAQTLSFGEYIRSESPVRLHFAGAR